MKFIPIDDDLQYHIAYVRHVLDGEDLGAIVRAKCELADLVLRLAQPGAQRPRLPIPFIVRAKVWARDHFQCVKCGSPDQLSLDHVIPHSLGGSDDEGNLQTLCGTCNSRKGARLDDE